MTVKEIKTGEQVTSYRLYNTKTGQFIRYRVEDQTGYYASNQTGYFFEDRETYSGYWDDLKVFEVDSWLKAFVALHNYTDYYNSTQERPCGYLDEDVVEVVKYQRCCNITITPTAETKIQFLSFQDHFLHAATYKRKTVMVVKPESNLRAGDIVCRGGDAERIRQVLPFPKDMRNGPEHKEAYRIAYLEAAPENFEPSLPKIP